MIHRREGELSIPLISILADAILIELAFLCSYWIRFNPPLAELIPVTKGIPPLAAYLKSSLVFIIVWLFIFQRFGLYASRRQVSFFDEFYSILKVVTLGMLIMMSAAFFYRGFSYSRIVFAHIWIVSIILLTIGRGLLLKYKYHRFECGRGLMNAAIIGSGKWASVLFDKIQPNARSGLRILGCVGNPGDLLQKTAELGSIEDLPGIIREHKIHVLLLALGANEHELLLTIMKYCEGVNVEFMMLPDSVDMMTSQPRIIQIGGIPLFQIKDVRIKGWESVLKRSLDLGLSILGTILLMPFFLIIALLIKTTSKGPVFYRQERIGFDGKDFFIYKFRSMKLDAEKETGPVWATKNDPRVTTIGRILRRTSLDELPQLINILLGDMSIVGPRPERKFFVEKFSKSVPKYLERHRVKSGMTGWAQIHGLRGNTPIEDRTRYDIYYVENWSLALDFKIILRTLWAVIVSENSY